MAIIRGFVVPERGTCYQWDIQPEKLKDFFGRDYIINYPGLGLTNSNLDNLVCLSALGKHSFNSKWKQYRGESLPGNILLLGCDGEELISVTAAQIKVLLNYFEYNLVHNYVRSINDYV